MTAHEPTRLLLAEVDLGLACEQFVKSDVGRYLIGRAKVESEDAVERLKGVDPDNPKVIRDIQNEIWRSDTFEKYLTDAILAGRNAEEQLQHDEDENQPGD
jgi:hypothetical protein